MECIRLLLRSLCCFRNPLVRPGQMRTPPELSKSKNRSELYDGIKLNLRIRIMLNNADDLVLFGSEFIHQLLIQVPCFQIQSGINLIQEYAVRM